MMPHCAYPLAQFFGGQCKTGGLFAGQGDRNRIGKAVAQQRFKRRDRRCSGACARGPATAQLIGLFLAVRTHINVLYSGHDVAQRKKFR